MGRLQLFRGQCCPSLAAPLASHAPLRWASAIRSATARERTPIEPPHACSRGLLIATIATCSHEPHPNLLSRNAAIEKWAKYKEDYHLRFRFTPRRVFDIALWGFAVPLGVYMLVKNESVRSRISHCMKQAVLQQTFRELDSAPSPMLSLHGAEPHPLAD